MHGCSNYREHVVKYKSLPSYQLLVLAVALVSVHRPATAGERKIWEEVASSAQTWWCFCDYKSLLQAELAPSLCL